MTHANLLDRQRASLLLIDVQERYRTVLSGWPGVVRAATRLVQGARLLGIPVLVTEQYPKGLGPTASEIAEHLPEGTAVVEKRSLSCCGAPAFVERLANLDRPQILVAGIETHACVLQTVHDLLAEGRQVYLARDATSSRRLEDVQPAWERMRDAGMLPTGSEQSLLELVRTADAPEFRGVQSILTDDGTL